MMVHTPAMKIIAGFGYSQIKVINPVVPANQAPAKNATTFFAGDFGRHLGGFNHIANSQKIRQDPAFQRGDNTNH